MIHHEQDGVELHLGDCRDVLRGLSEQSVHCVVTSPPYWGLRDYGIEPVAWSDGTSAVWGLEPTLEGYIAHTLEVFAEIGRVLRDDGVIWWNLGDCYATGAGKANNPGSRATPRGGSEGKNEYVNGYPASQPNRMPQSVSDGNKLLIPHRVAIALQDAGWIVRQDVVWAKASPMPESIGGWRWQRCRVKIAPSEQKNIPAATGQVNYNIPGAHSSKSTPQTSATWADCPGCSKCSPNGGYVLRRGNWRQTTAHEYVFMVAKSMGYFCDGEAAKEAAIYGRCEGRGDRSGFRGGAGYRDQSQTGKSNHNGTETASVAPGQGGTRNPRSVLRLSSEPFKGAHFATYPSKLVKPLIEASTSPAGCCPHCGQCWAPVVHSDRVATRPGNDTKVTGDRMTDGNRDPKRHVSVSRVSGYRPTCDCARHDPVPCTVLDICNGSGTTGQVARHLGLNYIGIDCNAEYLDLAIERINTPLQSSKPPKKVPGQLELF